MLYYVGKGTELKKEECKEYKKLKNALGAAAKETDLTVWDENGVVVGGCTDNVPDDGENGKKEDETENESSEPENSGNEANTTLQIVENGRGQQDNETETAREDTETVENGGGQQNSVIIARDKMKVRVVCEGALNLRRSPAWGNENICGRAMKGQTYYIEDIRMVDGKEMIKTIDGIFMSASPEYVRIERGSI